MDFKNNRRVIIGLGIIISFALLIFSITIFFGLMHDEREEGHLTTEMINNMSKEDVIQYMELRRENQAVFHSYYLIPFVSLAGVLVGTFVYYILSDKIVKQENLIQKNSKIILNFLTPDERKVIKKLLEDGGKCPQYELSHLPNLNRVKTHRILVALEQKGVIAKERLGKINKVTLNHELYEVLKD